MESSRSWADQVAVDIPHNMNTSDRSMNYGGNRVNFIKGVGEKQVVQAKKVDGLSGYKIVVGGLPRTTYSADAVASARPFPVSHLNSAPDGQLPIQLQMQTWVEVQLIPTQCPMANQLISSRFRHPRSDPQFRSKWMGPHLDDGGRPCADVC